MAQESEVKKKIEFKMRQTERKNTQYTRPSPVEIKENMAIQDDK